MAMYLIGDVQGCDVELQQLLQSADFSPSRDTLYLLGDLVNRGPASAQVLRRLMGYGAAACCLLGNHDLHLLAVAAGVRPPQRGDTFDDVLHAPDRPALLDWLRQQALAIGRPHGGKPLLMVHAGVLPQWTSQQTLALAQEVSSVLRSPDWADFLRVMYGNQPARWDDHLQGAERLRVIVNALTRLRFCSPQGEMEFTSHLGADAAPPGLLPWFAVPGRKTSEAVVAFGHWSTLGPLDQSGLWALDTGCVWGGSLSAMRLEAGRAERLAVACKAHQTPG